MATFNKLIPLLGKVHKISAQGFSQVSNMRYLAESIQRLPFDKALSGDLIEGAKLTPIEASLICCNGDFTNYMRDKTIGPLSSLIITDEDSRNNGIYQNDGSVRFRDIPNAKRPSVYIREWVRDLTSTVTKLQDYASRSPDQISPRQMSVLRFLYDSVMMLGAQIPGKKVTRLDKFLADNINRERDSGYKCLITRGWPKYRGMFGDHSSCFYPGRDHAASRCAVMEHGYIVRFYEENIPDHAILENPDNPVGVDNPLDTADEDQSWDDDEIENTDGCLGRCIIIPVVAAMASSRNQTKEMSHIGIINLYRHKGKSPVVGKVPFAEWLTTQIEGTGTTHQSMYDYGSMYINGGRVQVVAYSASLALNCDNRVTIAIELKRMVNMLYDMNRDELEEMDNEDYAITGDYPLPEITPESEEEKKKQSNRIEVTDSVGQTSADSPSQSAWSVTESSEIGEALPEIGPRTIQLPDLDDARRSDRFFDMEFIQFMQRTMGRDYNLRTPNTVHRDRNRNE